MANTHGTLKLFRSFHLYIGVFTAPALLFFALTGALQTFSLHETTQGSNYKPPVWIVMLAQIHKKQSDVVPVRKPKQALPGVPAIGLLKPDKSSASSVSPTGDVLKITTASEAKPKRHIPMKIFFLLVAVGLFTSTLTGLYMAYKYCRNTILISGLLFAGVIIPIVLLAF
jgi:hypothetical protein